MNAVDVSIVIPVKNAGTVLRETLGALFRQKTTRRVEVIAVDSGSEDGSLELLKSQEYGPVRLYEIAPQDFQHGRTRNFAVARARGELVVLLVQDAVPAGEKWLEALLNPFEDLQVAGVYSRQIPRPDADLLVKLDAVKSSANSPERRISKIDPVPQLKGWKFHRLCLFDNVSSCLRKSVWRKNPLPEVPFGEDLAWSRDIIKSGWKIVYEPRSVVAHSHNRSAFYHYKRTCMHHFLLHDLFDIPPQAKVSHAIRDFFRLTASAALAVPWVPGSAGERILACLKAPSRYGAIMLGKYMAARYYRRGKKPCFEGV